MAQVARFLDSVIYLKIKNILRSTIHKIKQSHYRPEGYRRLRFPDFRTIGT